MKKLLVIGLFCLCVSSSFAQLPMKTAEDVLAKAVAGELVDISSFVMQSMRQMHQLCRVSDEIATMEKYAIQFADITTEVPSVVALPPEMAESKTNVMARVLPMNDKIVYQQADINLRSYLMKLTQEEHTSFFYRGMRLSNLEELDHVLMYGLEISKSNYNRIYMSGHMFIAQGYSGSVQGKIPTIIIMEHDAVAEYLKSEMPGEFYSSSDLPPSAIFQILAFLEIDGKAGWYRVVLDGEERVFIPIPEVKIKVEK